MYNPFAKPHTPGQWLLGSVCWLVCCVGSWCGSDYLLLKSYPAGGGPVLPVFGCFCLAHLLIWRKVVVGNRAVLDPAQSPAAGFQLVAAYLWWLVVVLFQITCLLLVPIWYAFKSMPPDYNWLGIG
jgi:hypothetical protein